MKKFKEGTIFIIIFILDLLLIFAIPFYVSNKVEKGYFKAYDMDGPMLKRYHEVSASDEISDTIKNKIEYAKSSQTAEIVSERQTLYKLLLYYCLLISFLAITFGFVIVKKIKDKRYIGVSMISSSIVSIIFILFYWEVIALNVVTSFA